MSIRTRLARLQAITGTSEIPVWCVTPEQVAETIEAMVAEGEIRPADRVRCIFGKELRLHQVRMRPGLDLLEAEIRRGDD
jgi:hypothetical protein